MRPPPQVSEDEEPAPPRRPGQLDGERMESAAYRMARWMGCVGFVFLVAGGFAWLFYLTVVAFTRS